MVFSWPARVLAFFFFGSASFLWVPSLRATADIALYRICDSRVSISF
jgi:hypothetical protein